MTRGVVAAGHAHTAGAAEEILRSGGNAFDAAVAAMATACVAEPVLASLGGGGFALLRPARGAPRLLDFFVHTPPARRPGHELEFRPVLADFGTTTQEFHIGRGTIAVPGFVRGLFRLHDELGSMPMPELLRPATELAAGGVIVTDFQAHLFEVVADLYTATEACARQFASPVGDGLVRGGDRLRQPELADALESRGLEGERLFYEGEMARTLERDLADGGLFDRHALAAYEVIRREPLALRMQGVQVLTNPPPSSGGILTAFALGLLDAPDLGALDPLGCEYSARVVECQALTARERLERVSAQRPLDATLMDPELLARYREEVVGRARAFAGTTHISIIDDGGNLASVSLSNGEGSGYVLPGTGIVMNNMLGEEDLNPGGFHRWPAGERMTSMMMPTALAWPDGTLVATGSGGSNRIRSAVLQVLARLVAHSQSPEDAVSAPRLHLEEGQLNLEGGFDLERLAPLLEAWPQHRAWNTSSLYFGGAHTVRRGPRGADGCGDPRRSGVFRSV
jgi:gamma-glutamyltranspeptidase/glutathione hydrolase